MKKDVVYAIKFNDGTYYAGCAKRDCKTILGAQLYRSRKTAETTTQKSVNFPHYAKFTIVPVALYEIADENQI